MQKAPFIGIDLGTSKSCIAVFQNGGVELIPNEMGNRTTPSCVAFTDTQKLVGDSAKNQMNKNPTNTLFNILRLLGRQYEDTFIQENKKYWPFEIVKDFSSGIIKVQINHNGETKKYFIEEILAIELQQIKRIASNYLGKEVKDAVIGVPNCFNFTQRRMIKDAAAISGLNVYFAIGGPGLVSMYYDLNKKEKSGKIEENILIFDLGAGFFSVSLISIEESLYEVKAINGTPYLGGEDFDTKLMEYCIQEFKKKTSKDIMQNPKALRRLRVECENVKKILSSATKTTIELDNVMDEKDLSIEITREKFEELCIDLFKRFIPCLDQVLKDAKINKDKIDDILLIGGSTRIPKIQSMLKEYFNGKQLNKSLNPEESVAFGAAIKAAIADNIKDENIEKMILLDVTPISVGFEKEDGIMNIVIPKNSTIPCKKTITVLTTEDNQKSFLAKLYEGEKQLTKDNHLIGIIKLDSLPLKKKGQVEIEITFDIDVILNFNVTLVEKTTDVKSNLVLMYEFDRLNENYMKKFISEYQNEYQKEEKMKSIRNKVEEIFGWIKDNRNSSNDEIISKKNELIEFIEKNY